jgi:hypothetical protein
MNITTPHDHSIFMLLSVIPTWWVCVVIYLRQMCTFCDDNFSLECTSSHVRLYQRVLVLFIRQFSRYQKVHILYLRLYPVYEYQANNIFWAIVLTDYSSISSEK